MGRIKPPSGAIFNRALKPEAQQRWVDMVQQENYQLSLADTANILKFGEQVYTSPIVRDVAGGIASGISALVDEATEDDPLLSEAEEDELRKAAESRTGKKPPVVKAPAREPTAPAPQPVVQPVPQPAPPAAQPTPVVKPTAPAPTAQPSPRQVAAAEQVATPEAATAPTAVPEGASKDQTTAIVDDNLNNVQDAINNSGASPEEKKKISDEITRLRDGINKQIADETTDPPSPELINKINEALDEAREALKKLDEHARLYQEQIKGTGTSPTGSRQRPQGTPVDMPDLRTQPDWMLLNSIKHSQTEASLQGDRYPQADLDALEVMIQEAARRKASPKGLKNAQGEDVPVPAQAQPVPVQTPRPKPVITPPPGQESRTGFRQVGDRLASTGAVPISQMVEDALEDPEVATAPWDWDEVGETVKGLYALIGSDDPIYSSLGDEFESYLDELIPQGIETLNTDQIEELPSDVQAKLKGVLKVISSSRPPAPEPEREPLHVPRIPVVDPLTKSVQKLLTKQLVDAGLVIPSDAGRVVNDMVNQPGWEALVRQVPEEDHHEFVKHIVSIIMAGQQPAPPARAKAKKAPRPKLADFRFKRGMSVPEATALAVAASEAGFTQRDIAKLMDDGLHKLTGVGEGPVGRWAARGRPGGYFMTQHDAGREILGKVEAAQRRRSTSEYKRRILEVREQAEERAQRYDPVKRAKAGMQTLRIAGITEPERVKSARQRAAIEAIKARTMFTLAKVRAQEQQIKNLNPAKTYKIWVDAASELADLAKKMKKLTRTVGKSGSPTVNRRNLEKLQKWVVDSSKTSQRFSRDYLRISGNSITRTNAAIAELRSNSNFLDSIEDDPEAIAELYGGDHNAYLRDKRKAPEDPTGVIRNLEKRREETARKRREIKTAGKAAESVRRNASEELTHAKSKAKKLEALKKYNRDMETINNYVNKVLSSTGPETPPEE